MAVQFGIARFADGTYGIVQSVETEDTIEVATYAGGDGNTEGYNTYDRSETIKMELIYDSTQTAPAAGETATINTKKYVITSVGDAEAIGEFRKVTIDGKRWVTNTIPA